MKVTVIDREMQAKLWGHGYRSIHDVLRMVDIAPICPHCGGPRGKPHMERFHEDGEWYLVSRWQNPCGHTDLYTDVIKEAEQRRAFVR